MEIGDQVKMVQTHRLHNRTMKSYLDKTGTIDAIGAGANSGKVLVHFHKRSYLDKSDTPRWWVNIKYLQKL